MDDVDEINNAENSVGSCEMALGRNNPISLKSKDGYAYRVTGMDQNEDIINCVFFRPKGFGARRENRGDIVYWSEGGKVCFYDKGPVIEVPLDKVQDGQIGAVHIDDLSGIWLFNEEANSYINNINEIKAMYDEKHQENGSTIHR